MHFLRQPWQTEAVGVQLRRDSKGTLHFGMRIAHSPVLFQPQTIERCPGPAYVSFAQDFDDGMFPPWLLDAATPRRGR